MIRFRFKRLRYLLGAVALIGGASFADPLPAPDMALTNAADPDETPAACREGDFSVMTYNVAGLPWPLAKKGPEALHAIGERLSLLRARGCAPAVVVLQEAFSHDAKAIGRIAGYPYVVEGPYLRTGAVPRGMERSWMLGETAGTPVDSGLVILSELPVLDVKRAAFPYGACAGFDCLAAKGVLMATLQLADGREVMVAGTHFNSKGASHAPAARTLDAYRRQARFLADFIAANRNPDVPVVIAGDFNRGKRPDRTAALDAAIARLGGQGEADALKTWLAGGPRPLARPADAATIIGRGRDLQFTLDTMGKTLIPAGADIPFGTEPDGSMLSDHIGYTIRYRYSAS
ncbi:endonuclease/exonuclease/phosphatase family protein [Novosphingobium album (ex Hu et al. 2023)]|uniref:Endonuclease/exonuclease/phosphatase family protein n=1 Tax=Novosphingobium album (ex Hu et al. 2023) TaxID=2930093 RepID=A0ABT0B2W8_9SPHN|nr:endonuclease/exonuclease/phosphatase family protein [Novosphingobium album (ex Hu et al. 2023)]MCJ2179380.1 endonuclease/exonuclease/phosphatase family protein [Novosphingobium album (ex Hu et al. 2023)]